MPDATNPLLDMQACTDPHTHISGPMLVGAIPRRRSRRRLQQRLRRLCNSSVESQTTGGRPLQQACTDPSVCLRTSVHEVGEGLRFVQGKHGWNATAFAAGSRVLPAVAHRGAAMADR